MLVTYVKLALHNFARNINLWINVYIQQVQYFRLIFQVEKSQFVVLITESKFEILCMFEKQLRVKNNY